MKPRTICYAKESGIVAPGKGTATPAESQPAPAPAGQMAECPFGIPITLISATGQKATGYRSEYQPNWLDENHQHPLPFVPESWEKE